MEQRRKRKKVIWLIVLVFFGLGGYALWSAVNGPLFSPTPTVASDSPAIGPDATTAGAASGVIDTSVDVAPSLTGRPAPEAPELGAVDITTAPATAPDVQDAALDVDPGADSIDAAPDAPVALEQTKPSGTGGPTFDLVRVEDDGTTLVAGFTPFEGAMYLRLDEKRLANTQTAVDAQSDFVIFAVLQHSAQPQVLELEVIMSDGTAVVSDQKIFLSPRLLPAVPDVSVAVDNSPAAEPEIETAPEPQPEIQPETSVAIDRGDTLQAQTVLLAEADGSVRVLAPPVAVVALDTIQYDLDGEVALAGRAAGDGFVRVYLDNKPITTSRIESDGEWSTDLPSVDSGIYTLRVDEINDVGVVTSRVETPFKREAPEELTALINPQAPDPLTAMTVQPGTTLWAIATEKYGDGMAFMKVFEANRDRIRDPNMIFPGQIFDLPD